MGYNIFMSMVGVVGFLLFKYLVLVIIGYVFFIGKEICCYSFVIMVFWIIGGFIFSVGGLLLVYVFEGFELIFIGVIFGGFLIFFLLWIL